MNSLTILFHVDALRYDYINTDDAPFLTSLEGQGISASITPPFGFEPDGAYLAGLSPNEYDGGAHFVYAPESSPFRAAAYLSPVDRLNVYLQYPFRRLMSAGLKRLSAVPRVRKQPLVAWVPFRVLPYLDCSERFLPGDPRFLHGAETIFTHLRKRRLTFHIHTYPQNRCDHESVRAFLGRFDADVDFLYVMHSELDVVGHQFGPDSPKRHMAMRRFDDLVRQTVERLEKIRKLNLILFGDHGMVQVRRQVDVEALLARTGLVLGGDYLYFLDSTWARFGFNRRGAEETVRDALASAVPGRFLDQRDAEEYGVSLDNRKLGDAVFWLDGGTCISPDFWHRRRPVMGMHGYRREVKDNHAGFLYYATGRPRGNRLAEPISMQDVYATAMVALGASAGEIVRGAPLQSRETPRSVGG